LQKATKLTEEDSQQKL